MNEEIDGPSVAYFEYQGKDLKTIRVSYKTLAAMGRTPNLLVSHIYKKVQRLKDISGPDSILYWRRRPSLEEERNEDGFGTGVFKVTCRLQFVPELTDEVWEDIGCKPEGEEMEIIT